MTVPPALITSIEFAGASLIVGHCMAALTALARSQDLGAARLLVIQGTLWGLSLKTAASLLKTIELQSWEQIAAFAAVLTLRTVIKRVMAGACAARRVNNDEAGRTGLAGGQTASCRRLHKP